VINWPKVAKVVTPPGWKLVLNDPAELGQELVWDTGAEDDLRYAATIVTPKNVEDCGGRRGLVPWLRKQLSGHAARVKLVRENMPPPEGYPPLEVVKDN
jgi:hypothetical protein